MAKPHLPDNKALARECRDVKIDHVYIGSCTGGKLDDFIMAAKIMKGRKVAVRTLIVPATTRWKSMKIARPACACIKERECPWCRI